MVEDDLPTSYDVIIVGTGMVESILAAAVARSGKSVLHLDSNPYYGQLWTTFNFEGLENWYFKHLNTEKGSVVENETIDCEKIDLCSFHKTQMENGAITELSYNWHIPRQISTSNNHEGGSTEYTKKLEVVVNEEVALVEEVPTKIVTWTQAKIKELSRKFNIDLIPRPLFSNGAMVKLLLDSNVSRYTEFLSVTNVLTYINNRLEPVPCSKSDVFSSKNMTILDKRILMRILTICMNTEDDNSFQDFYDKSFCEFLEAQNVPENLIHYIIYAISQGSKRMPYLEGVQRAQIFLSSLGRFGNSPFLWPLYGSSELLQAYCRMCAIYGGIYYLNRGAESLVVNENFLCEGVMSNNMHLQSNHTIISASLAPASYCDSTMLNFISRGILITDRPLYSGAKPGISTFQFPAEDQRNPIMVIELNSDTYSCPNGLYIVHLTCRHFSAAEKDFEDVVNALFLKADSEDNSLPSAENVTNEKNDGIKNGVDKPRILFSFYFSMLDTSTLNFMKIPKNIHICPGPGLEMDYEYSINKAREIFETIYPGEQFMKSIPDQNDTDNDS